MDVEAGATAGAHPLKAFRAVFVRCCARRSQPHAYFTGAFLARVYLARARLAGFDLTGFRP
jgi:hypothetical protein